MRILHCMVVRLNKCIRINQLYMNEEGVANDNCE